MLTTIFNQMTAKILLAMSMLAGAVVIGAVPALGQMAQGQFVLTPAQQAAYTLATGLSNYEQQLVVNAMLKLGPQRANAVFTQLAQANRAMPGSLSQVGQRIIRPGLQSIPAQYHQAFVDGLLGVSSVEQQFALQVMASMAQAQQMQPVPQFNPFGAFPPSMGTGNSDSDGDPITARDFMKLRTRMMEKNYDTWRNRPNQ